MKSVCSDNHSSSLSTASSFLNISVPGAVLSAFRTGKDGMVIIRLYNCTEHDTEGVVSLFDTPEKAYVLDLNEDIMEETSFKGNTLQVHLKAAKILTLGFIM